MPIVRVSSKKKNNKKTKTTNIHRSETKPTSRTKKNKYADKIHIIFDLDATLINSVFQETVLGNEIPKKRINSLGPQQFAIIPDTKNNKGHVDITMFYRPFASELLTYLAKHPKVLISVWSTGTRKYVENICKVLIGPNWKEVMPIVISRKASTPKYTSIISQNGEVFDSDFENQPIKDLNVLFKHPKWGKIFTAKNTLLIDDNNAHYVKNKGHNIIHVPPWDGINSCDTVLFELKQWLESILKNAKINVSTLPVFEAQNTTGMTTGNKESLYIDLPTRLRTINKNNSICAPKLYKYHTCLDKLDIDADMSPEAVAKLKSECVEKNLIPSTQPPKKSKARTTKQKHTTKQKRTNHKK